MAGLGMAWQDTTIMALQLRPNCEYCDKNLPPNSTVRSQ